jgi:ABC-2 type transport system ATP-binding protein
MADGKVVAGGTVADIIGDRKVTEVRYADWARAFTALDQGGYDVQVHGQGVLRVTGQPEDVRKALAAGGIDAVVGTVGANLEEAFVAIVSGRDLAGRDVSGPAVA